MKTWKKVLFFIIVVLFILAVGFGIYFRGEQKKISMIRDLATKQEEILKCDTYYQKIVNDTDEKRTEIEYYQKGKKSISFSTTLFKQTNETAKDIMYENNGETKIYRETGKEELLEKAGMIFSMLPVNINFKDSSDKQIKEAMKDAEMSIKETIYNGKDCYLYKAKNIPEVYFDKETGLVLKYLNTEFEFELNHVDDAVFEPDLTGYSLVE